MSRITLRLGPPRLLIELREFLRFLALYLRKRGYGWFARFEVGKDLVVDLLYRQRGKYARPFLHFGTVALTFLVITFGPLILAKNEEPGEGQAQLGVLAARATDSTFATLQAEEVRQYRGGEIITHTVSEGETLSSIALRYGLQPTTIMWENSINEKTKLKPGQELRILPVDGIRHKVQRGETIFSVAKKYGLEDAQAQVIVDYPFNEFLNDETFELATGQYLMVPDAVKPEEKVSVAVRTPGRRVVVTPDAGTVTATGAFVWPASGQVSQGYRFYHKAYDIANRGGGPILAADGGTVVAANWDSSGYGNRVMVDHGNGYITLYGHLSVIQVREGQRVNRGDVLGQMGSTGRSTGVHLHFEIRRGGVLLDPGGFLR